MSDPRRYKDEEVREIFGLATRAEGSGESPARSAAEGLTLAEIQQIGAEVGLEPVAVARAAAALDGRAAVSPPATSLGIPIEVGRIVPLPRALTDGEWEQLVAELRATFRARGRVETHAGRKEWANGNLHACVEPSPAGLRLRMDTRKSNAAVLNALGVTGVVTGAVAFGAMAMSGGLHNAVFVPWMIAASGVAAYMANVLRMPRWAQRREAQMEHIAATVGAMLAVEAPKPSRTE